MDRCHRLASLAWLGFWLALPAVVVAAGPPFPRPVEGRAVYDEAALLSPAAEIAIEARIDAIEARSGAELVVYTQHDPDISEEENLAKAAELIDAWGVGRRGYDDGLAILIAKDPDPGETRIGIFAGGGFRSAYADEDELRRIVQDELIPYARTGDWDGALLATVDAVSTHVTPGSTDRLQTFRGLNAALGLFGTPLALIGTLGWAWLTWRREGDDPELVDSESILMAGPPADMTPPLATVVRAGRATQLSLNTTLVELAGTGRIGFENLDQVAAARSDSDPDTLLDPAIVIRGEADDRPLPAPERAAWETIRRLGIGGRLTRERLWGLNGALDDVKDHLEADAVRLGWLSRLPTPAIRRWIGIGTAEAILGGAAVWIGLSVPMSGATLVGGALILGGIGTIFFGRSMSQRTPAGAYVEAMLTAYRRTLRKTMEQARNIQQVVAEPTVRTLADTPDKAVVWGIALGLHEELGAVIARGLADAQRDGAAGGAYYPGWLGAMPGSAWSAGGPASPDGVLTGGSSVFSSSGLPDIGGMFGALGGMGSTPPSSSSSSSGGGGGGFGGGGSSGGGGASGSV